METTTHDGQTTNDRLEESEKIQALVEAYFKGYDRTEYGWQSAKNDLRDLHEEEGRSAAFDYFATAGEFTIMDLLHAGDQYHHEFIPWASSKVGFGEGEPWDNPEKVGHYGDLCDLISAYECGAFDRLVGVDPDSDRVTHLAE